MRERLLTLLTRLEEEIPVRPGCHHSIMLGCNGSALVLMLSLKEGLPTFRLDDNDFSRPVEELVEEVIKLKDEIVWATDDSML